MGKRQQIRTGPPVPSGMGGCTIQFGHNTAIGRAVMQFSAAVSQLVFTPEEADNVATQLHYHAKAARGEQVA